MCFRFGLCRVPAPSLQPPYQSYHAPPLVQLFQCHDPTSLASEYQDGLEGTFPKEAGLLKLLVNPPTQASGSAFKLCL